ncbi:MAG: hypothetical protein COS37_05020 [Anaerolineae bacterium CG03_land_8_20_14_0_80_58_20]|nr:MAG: hypothetical protein AUJ21_06245 [Anaerolineae bacterium CG1_02_58_13]PIV26709.1 MAG: hypothetical protein COS37_05020 [Anaerolineae bacterium CG03_land_8_20_14_0_80_58_20]
MNTKFDFDEEADVLYVSFGRSEHVRYVNLADNIVLRLDTGQETGQPPRAVGLTFTSFQAMRENLAGRPVTVPLANLRNLPDEVWQAVVSVISTAPVSDVLDVAFSFAVQLPHLPAPVPA